MRAFSLLELVLVLVIMAIAFGLAAPSMGGFARGRKPDDAAAQLVSLAHWARSQAISEAKTYRIRIDPISRTWWAVTVDGTTETAVVRDYGQKFEADESVRIETENLVDLAGPTITFEPGGRSQLGTIRFIGESKTVTVTCTSSLEEFHVFEPEAP